MFHRSDRPFRRWSHAPPTYHHQFLLKPSRRQKSSGPAVQLWPNRSLKFTKRKHRLNLPQSSVPRLPPKLEHNFSLPHRKVSM
jgi:hypothetical protein